LIIGGSGRDVIHGGIGEDLLFGGASTYYSEPTKSVNLVSLNAIMEQWTNGAAYATRVASLSAALVTPSKFSNDNNAVDHLFGDEDLDWFLRRTGDVIDDLAAGEDVTNF